MSTNTFVAPTGYVDLDNDCEYSIDRKSTRSREEVNPKEDLAFYFDTYIIPKYGLNNINVSNVASFMKDLEMNWTKLDPDMKGQVMNIMVDGILSKNSSFKEDLLAKLGTTTGPTGPTGPTSAPITGTNVVPPPPVIKQPFTPVTKSKSTFGSSSNSQSKLMTIVVILIIVALGFVVINNSNVFKQ
jgi:hypothetical protein